MYLVSGIWCDIRIQNTRHQIQDAMIHFTKYATEKFDILRRHKFTLTQEEVEDVLKLPDKVEKKDKLFFAEKKMADDCLLKVVYKKEEGAVKVVTFYPVK